MTTEAKSTCNWFLVQLLSAKLQSLTMLVHKHAMFLHEEGYKVVLVNSILLQYD